jgi:hypothetical protein
VSHTVMTFVEPCLLTSRSNNCFFNSIYLVCHLMVMPPHTKYHWPISKEKNVMARTRKYYLKNNYITLRSKVKVPWRSLLLVRSITFLSFEIGQWYLVCGCMTIRRSAMYRNDLRGTLTSRSNNCFLNSIYLVCGCMTISRCVTYRNDLRGTLTFDLKVK